MGGGMNGQSYRFGKNISGNGKSNMMQIKL
jgi:hypothetical protein